MDDTEDECLICSGCPERRRHHFSTDYIQIPINGICDQCQLAFWQAITVVCANEEELEAYRKALRKERLKGSLRPGQEILQELRSKRTKH